MNKNKFFKFFKIIVLIFSFLYIYENSKKNYQSVFDGMNLDYYKIFLSIVIFIFIQNLLSIRTFSFLNLTSKYSAKFSQWSNLFFLTGLINLNPLWGLGHILRSHEMKKNNFSYKEYVSLYFFIFFWSLLIYSLLLISIYYFLFDIKFFYLFILLTVFIISLIITSKIILNFCVKIFKRIIYFRFIKKIRFLNYFIKELLKLTELSALISNKKVFLNFFFYTLLLLCFEYLSLNLIFEILFENVDFQILFLFFLTTFLIRCVKPLDNIIGAKETIMGLYVQQLGLLFLEGALIVIIWRLLSTISLIINYIFFYFVTALNDET